MKITYEQSILMSGSSIGARIQAALSGIIPNIMIFDESNVVTDIVLGQGFRIEDMCPEERKALSIHGNNSVKKYMAEHLVKIEDCAFGLLVSSDDEILNILLNKDISLSSISEAERTILMEQKHPKTMLVLAKHGHVDHRMILGDNELVCKTAIDSFTKNYFKIYINKLIEEKMLIMTDERHGYYSHKNNLLSKPLQEALVNIGIFDIDIDSLGYHSVVLRSLQSGFDVSVWPERRRNAFLHKAHNAAKANIEYWKEIYECFKKLLDERSEYN